MEGFDQERIIRGVLSAYALVADGDLAPTVNVATQLALHSLAERVAYIEEILGKGEDVLTGAQQELASLLIGLMIIARDGHAETLPAGDLTEFLRGAWRFIDGRWS